MQQKLKIQLQRMMKINAHARACVYVAICSKGTAP